QKVETLLLRALSLSAGMGFVDNDQVRTRSEKVMPPRVRFNVVERHDGYGIVLEHGGSSRALSLKPGNRSGMNQHGIHTELLVQFTLPLLREMWWAKHT